MAKKSKSSQPPTPSEPSEGTLIMDPASSTRTQAMTVPGAEPALESTLILHPGAGDITASGLEPVEAPPASGATQLLDPEVVLKEQAAALPPFRPVLTPLAEETSTQAQPFLLWVGLGAAALALVGAVWYFGQAEAAPARPTVTAEAQDAVPAPVPTGYQETHRQAQAGDVPAMRTLGAVYTYGLGVPPNRAEGLRWYKKAAEAGSAVAAEEVRALEGPAKP